MGYFDLYSKLSDKTFNAKIQRYSKELRKLEDAVKKGQNVPDSKRVDVMMSIYRLCDYNSALFVPYYFPNYLGIDEHGRAVPLSLLNRPFTLDMFRLQFGGYICVRGSRQLGKTVTFGARQRMQAHLLPGYSSIYIAPHMEHIKTYANKLQEMMRAFRFKDHSPDHRKNLMYKEFTNRAKLEIARVHTSADDIRGKTVDEILLDESFTKNSYVKVLKGLEIIQVKILDILSGDKVVSFDANGKLYTKKVLGTFDKGKRHVWDVVLSDGSRVTCTGNTRFRTSKGFQYLCEFMPPEEARRCNRTYKIKSLITQAEAVGIRDDAWRREHFPLRRIRDVLRDLTGLQADGVCPSKASPTRGLPENSPSNKEKLGLRKSFMSGGDCEDSRIQFFKGPLLPEGSELREIGENGELGLVEQSDLGGDSLVVHGRRELVSGVGMSKPPHPGVLTPRERIDKGMVDQYQEVPCGDSDHTEAGKAGSLLHTAQQGGFEKIHEGDKALHHPQHAIQDQLHRRDSGVQILCENFLPLHRIQGRQPGMSRPGVLEAEFPGDQRSLDREHGNKKSEQDETGLGREEAKGRSRIREVSTGQTESLGGKEQRGMQPQEAGMAQEAEGSRPAENVGNLSPVYVESITYAGEQNVYDIEVEDLQTFFANGVAVHNCQHFDAEFYPELEQLQRASKMKVSLYSGTALTVDTALEGRYQMSSKGAWFVSCGCGNEIDMSDVEQALAVIQPDGPSCPKCRRILNMRRGRWIHANPKALKANMVGLHIPQIIIPDFVEDPFEWNVLYGQFRQYRGGPKFIQEVLGIPTEEGSRELSEIDIKRMCCLTDSPAKLKKDAQSGKYQYIISGVDWGGSEFMPEYRQKESLTVHAIIGVKASGVVDILHFKDYAGMGYRGIVKMILKDHMEFKAGPMAVDAGVGDAYIQHLLNSPLPKDRLIIFRYNSNMEETISTKTKEHRMLRRFNLNRTETLTTLFDAIKRPDEEGGPRVRCYDYGFSKHFVDQFLNLYRSPQENLTSGIQRFLYRKHGAKPDDPLHAVNFAYVIARIIRGEPIIPNPEDKDILYNSLRVGNFNQNYSGVNVGVGAG